jgi:hypothetical protein
MAVKIDVRIKDNRLVTIRNKLKKPLKKEYCSAIQKQLVRQIRGTGFGSATRFLPYHTYPSWHSGAMENSAYANLVSKDTIVFGATAPYSSVLETGRRMMWRFKHPFVFRGYYPNMNLVSRFLRARGRTDSYVKANRNYLKGEIAEAKFYMGRSADGEPASMKRAKIGKRLLKYIDKSLTSDTNVPGGKKQGNFPYGIYTVFAYRIRKMQPYHVFSKTAEWAKDYIRKDMEKSIQRTR